MNGSDDEVRPKESDPIQPCSYCSELRLKNREPTKFVAEKLWGVVLKEHGRRFRGKGRCAGEKFTSGAEAQTPSTT